MIKRIAMWKLKDRSETKELAAAINSLKRNVPSVLDIEVGVNINSTKSAFDLVFTATFESAGKLKEFEKDNYHKEISAKVSAAREYRVVVDYEVKGNQVV